MDFNSKIYQKKGEKMDCNSKIFQWDVNVFVSVPPEIKWVDYNTDPVTRVEVSDGKARIPDEYLETAGTKLMWFCVDDQTRFLHSIYVEKRPVPPDHATTPTETITFAALVNRVNSLIDDAEGIIDGAENLNIEETETAEGHVFTITSRDGTTKTVLVNDGKDGSDAEVTKENIENALGYVPADEDVVGDKMQRVVLYLSQVSNVYHLKDSAGHELTFDEFYDLIKDESNYVVILYGNSKLRPQYVSINEIHADGEDRDSQSTQFLRMVMTPTSLYYGTVRLADQSDITGIKENIAELEKELSNTNSSVSQLSESIDEISEPYGISRNIWDEDWEQGAISLTGANIVASSGIRCKNYIEVNPNASYYFMKNADICTYFYDENKNFVKIGGWSSIVSVQIIPNNVKYVRFRTPGSYGNVYKNDICINISDADDGMYSPHTNGEMSANDKKVRAEIGEIREEVKEVKRQTDDIFKQEPKTKNILPPLSEQGLYDSENGTPRSSSSYTRSICAICVDGYIRVYANMLETVDAYVALVCYKDEEPTQVNYLKTLSFNAKNTKKNVYTLPEGTKYIRLWIGASNYDLSKICLSFGNIEEYEPYIQRSVLKNEVVPNLMTDTIPLLNKNLVCFGDSIFGLYVAPDDIPTTIATLTGINAKNCAFGGTSVATHGNELYVPFSFWKLIDSITSNDFSEQENALGTSYEESRMKDVYTIYRNHLSLLEHIEFAKVEMITVAYGTNDFAFDFSIDNPNDNKDKTTYCGALRYSLEKLWSVYPNIRVFLCTPIFRTWSDGEDSDTKTQTATEVKLTDFVNAMKEVANDYHVKCIDNYYELGINKHNKMQYFDVGDLTHPNQNGIKLIGEHIANELF